MTIRAKAVMLIQEEDRYLFTECLDQAAGTNWYIPVGGGIMAGEYALQAAKREVMEELGEVTCDEVLLDISENIFSFNGIPEHEIVFSFRGRFQNKDIDQDLLQRNANDNGRPITLKWLTLQQIVQQSLIVYPNSLTNVLMKRRESV